MRKPRVVIAGQVPPPMGGQNVMVAHALESLAYSTTVEVVSLPFFFTRDWGEHRRVGLTKVWELAAVLLRLVRIRLRGRIDCLLFPFGGPHVAPLLRDIALLPFCRIFARRLVLHIHAGGIAEAMPGLPRVLQIGARTVYRRCDLAIVLTEFSRIDAASLGISAVEVIPNSLPDTYEPRLVTRSGSGPVRLLAVGHLGPPKGTPALLQSVAALRQDGHEVTLQVIGEALPPYSQRAFEELRTALNLQDIVIAPGLVVGEAKWELFGSADLVVFPSTAPESQPLVLLEAMMWALPIVATDWRAHREILGDPPGGVCYEPGADKAGSLHAALAEALSRRDEFEAWGAANRERYLTQFSTADAPLQVFLEGCVGGDVQKT